MMLDEFVDIVKKERFRLKGNGEKFASYFGIPYATKEQKIVVWHYIGNLFADVLHQIDNIPAG